MGKGSYLGGSTLIRGAGCHSPKAKTEVGPINLNAHLNKPKLPKNLQKKKTKGTKRQAEAIAAPPQQIAMAPKPASRAPRSSNGLIIPQFVERARKQVAGAEKELERKLRKDTKAALASVFVEVRRGGTIVSGRIGLAGDDVK